MMDVEVYSAEDGAPEKRIRGVVEARSIWTHLLVADVTAAHNRSQIDDMFDGAPPWDPEVLKNLGQSDRCNLNFGTSRAVFDSAFTGYLDLMTSVDVVARCKVKYGTPDQREEWAGVVSEEFHNLLSRWSSFDRNTQILATEFIKHGVGLALFPNDRDWRWTPMGLADAKFPKRSPIDPERIELVMVRRIYLPQELYGFIKDEEAAKLAGWNPEAVKNALIQSAVSNRVVAVADWEALQKVYKNNDFASSTSSTSTEISLIHCFVREFDGTVTFSIFPEESTDSKVIQKDPAEDAYLFHKPNFYSCMNRALTVFTYGSGNGFIHSIRGLGLAIFPHIQMENRLRCQVADSTMLSSALLLQIQDPKDLEDFGFTFYGPYAVINRGATVVERSMPNLSQNAMPVVEDLMRQMENNTGTYHLRQAGASGQERTKYEVQTTLAQQARLSQAAMNLFYGPWEQLLQEQMRRVVDPELTSADAGGKEAFEFRKRCMERGVPMEAIYSVYDVSAVRAVGYGSPGARIGALDEVGRMVPMLDEVGRNNALRDRIASVVGFQNVDRYLPKISVAQRIPVDAKIAELENGQLKAGMMVDVLPGENHAVHANTHLMELSNILGRIRQGEDPRPAVPGLNNLVAHVEPHIQAMSQDPTREQAAGKARQGFQQMSAVVNEITQHENARMRREAQAQAQAQVPSVPQAAQENPAMMNAEMQKAQVELQAKLQREETDMKIKAARAAQEMRIKEESHKQQMAMDDARNAMKIRSDANITAPATPL